MLFSSVIFLFFFFPVVFSGYYLLAFSRSAQNIWLFLFSILFYTWGEPVYVLLMAASIFMNWVAGYFVDKYKDRPPDEKRLADRRLHF